MKFKYIVIWQAYLTTRVSIMIFILISQSKFVRIILLNLCISQTLAHTLKIQHCIWHCTNTYHENTISMHHFVVQLYCSVRYRERRYIYCPKLRWTMRIFNLIIPHNNQDRYWNVLKNSTVILLKVKLISSYIYTSDSEWYAHQICLRCISCASYWTQYWKQRGHFIVAQSNL